MYKQFFRFRENPFKLAPDLAYLFLSSGHEEALSFQRNCQNVCICLYCQRKARIGSGAGRQSI